MIPPFLADGTRNPLTYNGFTFNQVIGADKRDTIEVNAVRVQTAVQSIREVREYESGLEAYGAFDRGKRLTLVGRITASSWGALYDRIEDMATAFNPAVVSRNNPTTFGYLPLDFSVPTAAGTLACRYYVRAEEPFEPPYSQYSGIAVPFTLALLAPDSRRYLQAESSLVGAGTADNTAASVWSWPTLTIAMTGAGSTDFIISNTSVGPISLRLNLSSLISGDSVVVDMERRSIKVNGVDTPSLFALGDYFHMEPGNNTITVTNGINASPTLTWRPAFSS